MLRKTCSLNMRSVCGRVRRGGHQHVRPAEPSRGTSRDRAVRRRTRAWEWAWRRWRRCACRNRSARAARSRVPMPPIPRCPWCGPRSPCDPPISPCPPASICALVELRHVVLADAARQAQQHPHGGFGNCRREGARKVGQDDRSARAAPGPCFPRPRRPPAPTSVWTPTAARRRGCRRRPLRRPSTCRSNSSRRPANREIDARFGAAALICSISAGVERVHGDDAKSF